MPFGHKATFTYGCAQAPASRLTKPCPASLFLLYKARALIIRSYADSSTLSKYNLKIFKNMTFVFKPDSVGMFYFLFWNVTLSCVIIINDQNVSDN